jgi:hypothetical protein
VLDRLEPAAGDAGEGGAHERGLRLVGAGLAHGDDPPQRPVSGGVVLAVLGGGGVGGDAGEPDQDLARAVLEPDPWSLQGQPQEEREVGDEVGDRHERGDQPAGGEQRRVGHLRACVVDVGVVQPPVQMLDLALDLGGGPIRRDADAQFAQQSDAQLDGVAEPVPVGQAAHLYRSRVRALRGGGTEALDRPVVHLRLLQAPQAVPGALAADVHLDERGRLAPVDQWQGGAEQRADQRVVTHRSGVGGGVEQQVHHPLSFGRVVDRVGHGQVLFGGDSGEFGRPGQPTSHGQLQLTPRVCVQPAQDRLLDAVVAEPHRLVGTGLDHQDTLVDRRCEQLFQHTGRYAGRGAQRRHGGPPPQARHRLHQLPGLRRQGRHGCHRRAAGLGAAQAQACGGRVPAPSRGRRGQHAVTAQRVEQLHGLVRVPGGVRLDHLGQVRRRGRVRVQHLGDHGDQTGHGQVGQPQVPHTGAVGPAGQRRGQRIGAVLVMIPVRAHQQQALDRLLVDEQVDEAERGSPGPLQVVEDQHDRSFRRCDGPQDLHAVALSPHLRGQRIAGIGWYGQQRGVLRNHRGHQTGVRAERRADPFADHRQLVLRLGEQQPAQRAERLVDRAGLQVSPELVELAGHEPAVAARHDGPQLVDQRRLPHPGRSTDQHHPAPSGECFLERRVQRRHLGIAAHQPRRRQQPQRDVVVPDAARTGRRVRPGVAQPLQVVEDALRGLIAVVRLLLQQMQDDLGQRPG